MQKKKTIKTLIITIFVLSLASVGIFTIINRNNEQLYRALRKR